MIVYITRKYPPSVGGMQKASHRLAIELSKRARIRVIAWGHSQTFLPLFVGLASLRAATYLLERSEDVQVLLGDALLAPLGMALQTAYRVPVAAIANGLDITFRNQAYQTVVPHCLRRLDRVICISSSTRQEVLNRGVPAQKSVVIPFGVDLETEVLSPARRLAEKEALFGENAEVLLTVGRLVERKGVAEFIETVLPTLLATRKNLVYAVVGAGPQQERIAALVRGLGLGTRVRQFGHVDDSVVERLYSVADIFVMPNIPVPGDMEGLGLVALESSAAGLPVVAARLEGIQDVVSHGENGFLVEPGDALDYTRAILELLGNPSTRDKMGRNARDFVSENYHWSNVAERYLAVLGAL